MSYNLSATLSGHEQDVRAVASPDSHVILSALRDGTVRSWNPTTPGSGWAGSTGSESAIAFNSPSATFVNSLTFVNSETEPLIANAGQDAMIYLSDFVSSGSEDPIKYQLIGHQGNICALNYKNNEIISASWDTTAKVWDLNTYEIKFDLKGHEAAVWDAKIVGNDQYLTCSADRTIRLWQGSHEIKRFNGHSDVVRKLQVLPGSKTFVSASNDGTIKLWDIESGQILQSLTGHDSFVYDVNILLNGDLVSTGEDRSVRIWRDGTLLQVITLPCVSVWCVSPLDNGDFCVGCSDKTVRVFSREPSRQASQQELSDFRESVQNSSIAEQSVDDLKKTDIRGYDALSSPGKHEGAVIMVKSPEGKIEAHQWASGEWIKIGDVVGSSGNTDKKEYGGKKWDYVFDVDVKDGEPPLKLPYNVNENPYTAAQRFLADHELPSSYTEEVVNFIQKNTEGVSLDQQVGAVENPYADSQNKKHTLQVIPETTFIDYKDYVSERLLKGVVKLNSEQDDANKFTELEIGTIKLLLIELSSKEALDLITQFISKIMKTWTPGGKLVGFDLMRIAIPRVTAAHVLSSTEAAEIILHSLNLAFDLIDEKQLALLTVVMKALSNLIQSILFVQLYVDPLDNNRYEYNQFFKEMLTKLSLILKSLSQNTVAREHKFYNTSIMMVSSFVYNLSANHLRTSAFKSNPNSAQPIVDFVNDIGDILVKTNSESAYRLAVAYGNFKSSGVNFTASSWLTNANDLYAKQGSERRFQVLAEDLLSL